MRRLVLTCLPLLLACSSSPTSGAAHTTTTPEELPLPAPRFAAREEGVGFIQLGMTRAQLTRELPLELRLMVEEESSGLWGEAVTLTDEQDKLLFQIGFVDGEVAWILAEEPSSQVGTEAGVGFGSSLAFARKTLGEETKVELPQGMPPFYRFARLRRVAFGFEENPLRPESKISRILVFDEDLLPGARISFQGIALPESRVAFASGGLRHEARVQLEGASLPVGTLVEGEGVRDETGRLVLSRFFAARAVTGELPEPLRSRLPDDPDFLSYIALLTVREGLTGYAIEGLPEEHAALLVLKKPRQEGYALIRLPEAGDLLAPEAEPPLKISAARFGVSREEFLGKK